MPKVKNNLSIIIISGNYADFITDCLNSALFADEIILVAANCTDDTPQIARKIRPDIKIIETFDEYNKNFAKWRNLGLKKVTNDWILYLDTDERITPSLKTEILTIIKKEPTFSYYVIPRFNHYLGTRVKYGGSYPDYVKRLFYLSHLSGFSGAYHEEPIINGNYSYLKNPLLHYTHHDLTSMLDKSIAWTDLAAKELNNNNHPPVVWWRFLRMMITTLSKRLIVKSFWRDGIVGWISSIFETYDTFMIYARLWELQNNPSLSNKDGDCTIKQ